MNKNLKILIVDDEKNIRTTLGVSLADEGHEVKMAASLETAVKELKNDTFDLVLTDYRLGGPTGSDVIREVKHYQPKALIVVMTAYSSIENAIQVTREGAFDYLQKPFMNSQLEHVIEKVTKVIQLMRENEELKQGGSRIDFFFGTTSPAMQRLEQFINQVAGTDETILITGESGTGKSELAKIIHQKSKRSKKPLVTVYCTTLTESVLESELFGYVRGAFTGANQDKAGKLEQADGGTLFLDEIGDLSPNAQAKLLRFLQEKVIERVGGIETIKINARVITATNKNLQVAVEEGKFREDLFYRLNMLDCHIVPLRHRRDDIPVLISRFLRDASLSQGLHSIIDIPKEVYDKLVAHNWNGNVRELKNTIERLVILSLGRQIDISDLPKSIMHPKEATSTLPLNARELKPLEEVEREYIASVLLVESNFEKAAAILGITPVTLWRKRKQYGLN